MTSNSGYDSAIAERLCKAGGLWDNFERPDAYLPPGSAWPQAVQKKQRAWAISKKRNLCSFDDDDLTDLDALDWSSEDELDPEDEAVYDSDSSADSADEEEKDASTNDVSLARDTAADIALSQAGGGRRCGNWACCDTACSEGASMGPASTTTVREAAKELMPASTAITSSTQEEWELVDAPAARDALEAPTYAAALRSRPTTAELAQGQLSEARVAQHARISLAAATARAQRDEAIRAAIAAWRAGTRDGYLSTGSFDAKDRDAIKHLHSKHKCVREANRRAKRLSQKQLQREKQGLTR